jgi:hypothetical protein
MSAQLPAYCTALLAWKTESNLTFSEIAEKLQRPEVWTTALFFGQAKTDEETAKRLLDIAGTPADGLVKYSTIDDPTEKAIPASLIIKGLSGKGVDSKGVDGMITRGGTWEWPPKVSPWKLCRPKLTLIGPGHLPALRGLGRIRHVVQGLDQREGNRQSNTFQLHFAKASSATASCLRSVSDGFGTSARADRLTGRFPHYC